MEISFLLNHRIESTMLISSHTNTKESEAITVHVSHGDEGSPSTVANADVIIDIKGSGSKMEADNDQTLTASQNIKSSIITPPILESQIDGPQILMKEDRILLER